MPGRRHAGAWEPSLRRLMQHLITRVLVLGPFDLDGRRPQGSRRTHGEPRCRPRDVRYDVSPIH